MRSRKARKPDPNQKKLLIGDDLLIEILSRIPTPVVAIRCKLVCKSWCSLISSSYFIRRFKQQHINHPKPLSGILANTFRRVNIAEDSDFNFRGFNLNYLPKKYGNIMVVAYCNDLIMIEDRNTASIYDYECYLCNPFTMQWVALPPQPLPQYGWGLIKTGLVCEPYNGGDQIRYRIVRFYSEDGPSCEDFRYHLVIYCSETSEWIPYDDRGKEYRVGSKSLAAYNGKLHWVYGDCQYLVTLDPFNMRQTSIRLLNGANFNPYDHYHIGECEGVLRVMRFERLPIRWGEVAEMIFKGISVWELQEDEDTARLIPKDYIVLNEGCKSDLRGIDKVGFHPRNKDVLFLENDFLASFNTKTRKLKFETEFKDSYSYRYLFTLQLPWWPTPIPKSVILPHQSMTIKL